VDLGDKRDLSWWEAFRGEQNMWGKVCAGRGIARREASRAWPGYGVGMNINLSTESLLTDSFGEFFYLLVGSGLFLHELTNLIGGVDDRAVIPTTEPSANLGK
jgi:hypothetical protein